jgi:hypothetical protein
MHRKTRFEVSYISNHRWSWAGEEFGHWLEGRDFLGIFFLLDSCLWSWRIRNELREFSKQCVLFARTWRFELSVMQRLLLSLAVFTHLSSAFGWLQLLHGWQRSVVSEHFFVVGEGSPFVS